MTLGEFIPYWLTTFKERSVKGTTYSRLQTTYKAMVKYPISNMPIKDITCFDIQDYVNMLVDDYSFSGIKKMMRIVTAPLSKAAAMHMIPSDPSIGIQLPNRQNIAKQTKVIDAYTPQQQDKLWGIINTWRRPAYAVIAFMMEQGTRIGQTICLQWNDIDLRRGAVRIHKTVQRLANKKQSVVRQGAKSFTSNRMIPLTKTSIDILTALRNTSSSRWVFVGSDGCMISYQAVRYQTQMLCKQAEVPYRGEHVFRHTFATNGFHRNVDIKILSKILGHSSTAITYDTYINLYGDGFDEMVSAMR